MRRVGSPPLKILLLIVCIAAALFVIYLRLRPPPPARLAPDARGFGRSAARNAHQQSEEPPSPDSDRRDDPSE